MGHISRSRAGFVGPYHVRVINGDRFGGHRVASGTVTLNGAEIVSASQLTSAAEFVDAAPLPTLPVENTITFTLTGAPDAFMTVVLQDSTVR
jgi:hypothetical protein